MHHGVELRFDGEGHRIPFDELTGGRSITIYGQQEVVKDLIAARLARAGAATSRPTTWRSTASTSERPAIRFRHAGERAELECDVIAGCDGFHGVCRAARSRRGAAASRARVSVRAGSASSRRWRRRARSSIYATTSAASRCTACARRSSRRLYLQCDPRRGHRGVARRAHLGGAATCASARDGWSSRRGRSLEKGITPMRSFVAEPMQHGRLFLAGDAAHIVPPTGAKGLNLAVADVRVLADALVRWFESRRRRPARRLLGHLPAARLARGALLVVDDVDAASVSRRRDGFQARLQRASCATSARSRAAATALAENYVGAAGDLG